MIEELQNKATIINLNSHKFQKWSKFQKRWPANKRMDDTGDEELMKMKEHAGLGDEEWRRVLEEAR